jgi:hypothetical protein
MREPVKVAITPKLIREIVFMQIEFMQIEFMQIDFLVASTGGGPPSPCTYNKGSMITKIDYSTIAEVAFSH